MNKQQDLKRQTKAPKKQTITMDDQNQQPQFLITNSNNFILEKSKSEKKINTERNNKELTNTSFFKQKQRLKQLDQIYASEYQKEKVKINTQNTPNRKRQQSKLNPQAEQEKYNFSLKQIPKDSSLKILQQKYEQKINQLNGKNKLPQEKIQQNTDEEQQYLNSDQSDEIQKDLSQNIASKQLFDSILSEPPLIATNNFKMQFFEDPDLESIDENIELASQQKTKSEKNQKDIINDLFNDLENSQQTQTRYLKEDSMPQLYERTLEQYQNSRPFSPPFQLVQGTLQQSQLSSQQIQNSQLNSKVLQQTDDGQYKELLYDSVQKIYYDPKNNDYYELKAC